MRILLLVAGPFRGTPAGRLAARCGRALLAAGHAVRAVAVDDAGVGGELPTQFVRCDPGGDPAKALPFSMPTFDTVAGGAVAPSELDDDQLAAYRETLRSALDAEIDRFNPHLVHAQYVSIEAHLALEAGVPYVAHVHGPELALAAIDARIGVLAQESAENAGHLLLASDTLRPLLERQFGTLDRGVSTLEADTIDDRALAGQLESIYLNVLHSRYGHVPE